MSVIHAGRFLTERHKRPSSMIVMIKDVDGGGLVLNLDETRLLQLIWTESEADTDGQVTALFQFDGRQEDIRILQTARGKIEHMLHTAVTSKAFVSLADDDRLLLFRCTDLVSARVSRPFISPTRDRNNTVCRLEARWNDGTEFDFDFPADRAGEVLTDFEAAMKRNHRMSREPLSLA